MTKWSVVWVQGITCNGNTHSFFNYKDIEKFFKDFQVIYHPLFKSDYSYESLIKKKKKIDFLIIEGAITEDIKILNRFGKNMYEILTPLIKQSKHVLCMGSCASFGGVFRERDDKKISGLAFSGERENGMLKTKSKESSKVYNISGCPAHPEWVIDTMYALRYSQDLERDELLRPKENYSNLVHHGCSRGEYFEWKVDSHTGNKEGCLFYEDGCKGPMTKGTCNITRWNEVSSKTKVGTPCIGCTNFNFPTRGMFETKTYMSIPAELPLEVPKRAYYSITGIAKSFFIKRLNEKLF